MGSVPDPKTIFIVVIAADGGAKRAGGVTIVPISSSKSAGRQDSNQFNDDDADDAMLSMCTDNEGDELLTSAFSDDTLMQTDDPSLS